MTELDHDDALHRLTAAIRAGDITADEALAALAYITHGDTTPLLEARDEGAEIGAVGRGAVMLMRRVTGRLTPSSPHPHD